MQSNTAGQRADLFSTAGLVLICLANNPDARLRDVAKTTNTTERTVWNAINDLETAGVITRHKLGRRNSYTINGDELTGLDDTLVSVSALLALFDKTV